MGEGASVLWAAARVRKCLCAENLWIAMCADVGDAIAMRLAVQERPLAVGSIK